MTSYPTRVRREPRRFDPEDFVPGANNKHTVGRVIDAGIAMPDEEHEERMDRMAADDAKFLDDGPVFLEEASDSEASCSDSEASDSEDGEESDDEECDDEESDDEEELYSDNEDGVVFLDELAEMALADDKDAELAEMALADDADAELARVDDEERRFTSWAAWAKLEWAKMSDDAAGEWSDEEWVVWGKEQVELAWADIVAEEEWSIEEWAVWGKEEWHKTGGESACKWCGWVSTNESLWGNNSMLQKINDGWYDDDNNDE